MLAEHRMIRLNLLDLCEDDVVFIFNDQSNPNPLGLFLR